MIENNQSKVNQEDIDKMKEEFENESKRMKEDFEKQSNMMKE